MKIYVTFDPKLDFFLADRHQGEALDYPLTRSTSVKDIIESLGVPHTEVGGIRSDLPYDQMVEVIDFFGLRDQTAFFSRCTRCNQPLKPVDKTDILDRLEPRTRKYFFDFFQCPACGKVF